MNPYRAPNNDNRKSVPSRLCPALFANMARAAILLPFLLIAISALALVAYGYYESQGVESFCEEVVQSEARETIIARADARGLFRAGWQGTDDIWILNKPLDAAPMFRFACEVKFNGGKVSGKEVIDAD